MSSEIRGLCITIKCHKIGFVNQVILTFWFLGNDTMLLKSTPELVDTFFDAAKRVWHKTVIILI